MKTSKLQVLKAAKSCNSYRELGEKFDRSKQRMYQLAQEHGILEDVRKLIKENKSLGSRIDVPLAAGRFSIQFGSRSGDKRYYGYSAVCREAVQSIVSSLNNGDFSNEALQEDFAKFGQGDLVIKFFDEGLRKKDWLRHKRTILSALDTYNVNLADSEEEIQRRKDARNYAHNHQAPGKRLGEDGIFFHRSNSYFVRIYLGDGQHLELGYHKSLKAARAVRDEARVKHPRTGRAYFPRGGKNDS